MFHRSGPAGKHRWTTPTRSSAKLRRRCARCPTARYVPPRTRPGVGAPALPLCLGAPTSVCTLACLCHLSWQATSALGLPQPPAAEPSRTHHNHHNHRRNRDYRHNHNHDNRARRWRCGRPSRPTPPTPSTWTGGRRRRTADGSRAGRSRCAVAVAKGAAGELLSEDGRCAASDSQGGALRWEVGNDARLHPPCINAWTSTPPISLATVASACPLLVWLAWLGLVRLVLKTLLHLAALR